jgi:hypothetical protein
MPQSHWVTHLPQVVPRAGLAPMLLRSCGSTARFPRRGRRSRRSSRCRTRATWRPCAGSARAREALHHRQQGRRRPPARGQGQLSSSSAPATVLPSISACVDYANPVADLLKHAQRHNMLTPWSETERPAPQNPIHVDVKPHGTGDATRFHATIDATARLGRLVHAVAAHVGFAGAGHLRHHRRVGGGEGRGRGVSLDHAAAHPAGGPDGDHRRTAGAGRADHPGRRRGSQVDELPLMDPRRTAVEARWEVIQSSSSPARPQRHPARDGDTDTAGLSCPRTAACVNRTVTTSS